MNKKLPILPKKVHEPVQEQLNPYYISKSDSDTVFSQNRGNDIKSGENDKDFSIGLKDIDEAIIYYFDNVLKPSVVQNGQRISVPILYSNQELWKSIQEDGYIRDNNGKLMTPLITFKRDSVEKNRDLGNKLDGNKVHLHQVFEKRYTKENRYDKFNVINNRQPIKEFIATVVPDYVTISYSCFIFTEYMLQLNSLIEAINFASDSYWGDYNRFKFRTSIDGFNTVTELNIGEERIAKASFSITLYGYLIPNTVNKEIASIDKFYSKGQVLFTLETTTTDLNSVDYKKIKPIMGATNVMDSFNISIHQTTNVNISGSDADIVTYFNTSHTHTATVINGSTAVFNKPWLSAPIALSPTSIDNFIFFCNGQYIEKSSISSFTQNIGAGTSTLVVDTNTLGFSFESGDVIIGIGKFSAA